MTPPTHAQRLFGKNIEVEAVGYGIDSVAAIADAKRNASEMAYKMLLSSDTRIENDEMTFDAVSVHSYGMIKKCTVVESCRDDSVVSIKIKAVVYFSKFLGGKDKVKSKVKVKGLKI